MNVHSILLPVCGQVALTFVVWVALLYGRISTHLRLRIPAQVVADPKKADELYQHLENISDNLENLFEIPVLFFVASLVIFALGLTDNTYVGMAWGFVGLRAAHSAIHCTRNRILWRFRTYTLSSLLVWGMWGRLAWQLGIG